jgi:hypothetical protein
MLWLVQANRATAGKAHLGNRAPSRFLNFRALNSFLGKASHLRFQVVANEIEFVRPILIGRMKCGLSWRQGKDQPTMTRIHGFEPENVAEECTVGLGVFAVDNYMSG